MFAACALYMRTSAVWWWLLTRCTEPEFTRAVVYLHDTNFIITALGDAPYIVLSREWYWHTYAHLLPHWRAARHLPALPFPDGVFPHQGKSSVWPSSEYPDRILPVVIQILRETGQLVPYGAQQDTSLVPTLLETSPLTSSWEPQKPALQRVYEFAAKLPPAFIVQLISRASVEHSVSGLCRTGLTLTSEGNRLRMDVQGRRYASRQTVYAPDRRLVSRSRCAARARSRRWWSARTSWRRSCRNGASLTPAPPPCVRIASRTSRLTRGSSRSTNARRP